MLSVSRHGTNLRLRPFFNNSCTGVHNTQEADPAICKEENRVLESYFDQLEHDNVPQSRKQ